jgi:hypothetical protein
MADMLRCATTSSTTQTACGNSIGGYAPASKKGGHSNGGGSSYHDVFVNNTLYNNAPSPAVHSEGGQPASSRFRIRWAALKGTFYENNVVYAGTPNTLDLQLRTIFSDVSRPTGDPQLEPLQLGAGYVEGTSIWWGGRRYLHQLFQLADRQRRRCRLFEHRSALCRSGSTRRQTLTRFHRRQPSARAAPASCASDGWCDPMAVRPIPSMAAPTSSGTRGRTART